jgi:hypothetical protein
LAGLGGTHYGDDVGATPQSRFAPDSIGVVQVGTGWNAPLPPTITSPANGEVLSALPRVAGACDAGTAVIFVDGIEEARTVATTTFSVVLARALAPGTHQFWATLEVAGVQSGRSDVVFARVAGSIDAGASGEPTVLPDGGLGYPPRFISTPNDSAFRNLSTTLRITGREFTVQRLLSFVG